MHIRITSQNGHAPDDVMRFWASIYSNYIHLISFLDRVKPLAPIYSSRELLVFRFGCGSWKTKLAGLWPNEAKLGDGGERPATTIHYLVINSDGVNRLVLKLSENSLSRCYLFELFEAVVETHRLRDDWASCT